MKTMMLILGLWCAMALPATALPLFSISQTQSGGVVHVAVLATGATDLYGYQFSLNFNPTVLRAISVAEGPFLASAGSTFFSPGTIDNAAGQVSFIFDTLLTSISGANGGGVLGLLDFSILRTLPTSLSLSDLLAVDSQGNVLASQAQGLQFGIPEPPQPALLAIALMVMALAVRRQRRRGRRVVGTADSREMPSSAGRSSGAVRTETV